MNGGHTEIPLEDVSESPLGQGLPVSFMGKGEPERLFGVYRPSSVSLFWIVGEHGFEIFEGRTGNARFQGMIQDVSSLILKMNGHPTIMKLQILPGEQTNLTSPTARSHQKQY